MPGTSGLGRSGGPIVRTHHSSRGAWVAPSIIWGIGVGLIIAAADAVTIFLAGTVNPPDWPIDDIDTLVNIALFSLIGFKVGRATGTVRDAAEAGVMAG